MPVDPFVGEIRAFAFGVIPYGWTSCDGQLLPISTNVALFSILGSRFGGNGKSNFAVPDLNGRVPIGAGQGPGLTARSLGGSGGQATVVLTEAQIPTHTHASYGYSTAATSQTPQNGRLAAASAGYGYAPSSGTTGAMADGALAVAGGGGAHNNLMPYLVFNYCIAIQGVFPPHQ